MELLDLYNENGSKTGRQVTRGTWLSPQEYILVVHLCVFDSYGRMLIQRRASGKRRWGGLWDFTVGGHTRMGEDSHQAILREAREELGLNVRRRLQFAVQVKIPQVLDDFYLLREDIDLDTLILQTSEVSDVRWVTWPEVLNLIEAGLFVGYDSSLISKLFLYGQNMPKKRKRNSRFSNNEALRISDDRCLLGT